MATTVETPADGESPGTGSDEPRPQRAGTGPHPVTSGPVAPATGLNRWGPVVLLAAMVATYFGLFGFLVYRQQSNFGTFGFDIGIRDQGIWLVAHGHTPFMTVRGLDFFAENVELISLLFVPFYWLGAGPHFLIVVHTAVVSLGAVPLWLLGRDRFGRRWLALVPPLAYLLYPAVHWVTWWAYHPDSMAITPLLFAWWLAVRRRWGWYAVAAGLALLCKEDVALAVVMLGVAVAFAMHPAGAAAHGRARSSGGAAEIPRPRDRVARTVGLSTAGIAVAWFLLCTHVIIPWRNHHVAPFYESFFPSFGRSTTEILYNLVRHPSRAIRLALRHNRRRYDLKVFAPVAFLPFFALPALLVAGPQFGINTIVEVQNGATIASQYASIVIVGVFLGTVEGMAWLGRRLGGWIAATPATPVPAADAPAEAADADHRQHVLTTWVLGALCAILLTTSLWTTSAWGLSPLSTNFHSGLWVAHPQHRAAIHKALTALRPSDGVSVTYYVTPHVTHRQYVYEFPNPWANWNYGNTDFDLGRPDKVTWLILDRSTLRPDDATLLNRLTRPGGPFAIVEDEDGIVTAHRVGPG